FNKAENCVSEKRDGVTGALGAGLALASSRSASGGFAGTLTASGCPFGGGAAGLSLVLFLVSGDMVLLSVWEEVGERVVRTKVDRGRGAGVLRRCVANLPACRRRDPLSCVKREAPS